MFRRFVRSAALFQNLMVFEILRCEPFAADLGTVSWKRPQNGTLLNGNVAFLGFKNYLKYLWDFVNVLSNSNGLTVMPMLAFK